MKNQELIRLDMNFSNIHHRQSGLENLAIFRGEVSISDAVGQKLNFTLESAEPGGEMDSHEECRHLTVFVCFSMVFCESFESD